MAEFRIRAGSPTDFPVVTEIYRRASLHNTGDVAALLAHPEGLILSDDGLVAGRTRVATHAGRIVGFATLQQVGGVAELEDLFVDPDWMRRGVGRLLVLDAVAMARRGNVARIEVTANPHALAFYENVGFVGDGRVETALGHGVRMHRGVEGVSVDR